MGSMLKKRCLLVSIAVIALAGVLAAVALSDEPADGADVITMSPCSFDVVAALENAVSGDTVTLDGEAVLGGNATVKEGVVFSDGGFPLTIDENAILSVYGQFVSTGNLTIHPGGGIIIASGGEVKIDNEWTADSEKKPRVNIDGTVNVSKGGVLNIGIEKNSYVRCFGDMYIEGDIVVGSGKLCSKVDTGAVTLRGDLQVNNGSVFLVREYLIVGKPPIHFDEKSDASVSGKVDLTAASYILVYGESSFNPALNIRSPPRTVSTDFIIQGNTFAAEYKYRNGTSNIIFPSTSELTDYYLVNWKNSATGEIMTEDVPVRIGAVKEITGEVTKQTYKIVLTKDESIRWVVNGIEKGSSGEEKGVYGASYKIDIRLAAGYTELPTLFRDGKPFAAGTSFTVDGDTVFTTSNYYLEPSGSPVTVLITILVALLIVFVVSYMLLINKKNATQ
jgi:hypothetical protein